MKLTNDWKDLFMDDDFQQDLVFLIYVTLLLITKIIPTETFGMLAGIIIGGDAVKKLGKKRCE